MTYGQRDFYVDLAAENVTVAAERGHRKIAVEIKSLGDRSPMRGFENAVGQFVVYRMVLQEHEPERQLYLAIPEAIIDPSGDHYLVMHVGWQGNRRVHSCILHVDIIEEKVWIEHDGTSDGVADALLAAGIPPESIVLGFQPPEIRRLSEFAEA